MTDADRAPFITFYRSLVTPNTHSVLELGCGTGTIAIEMADQLHRSNTSTGRVRVVGFDQSFEMLRIARVRGDRLQLFVGDLPFQVERAKQDLECDRSITRGDAVPHVEKLFQPPLKLTLVRPSVRQPLANPDVISASQKCRTFAQMRTADVERFRKRRRSTEDGEIL